MNYLVYQSYGSKDILNECLYSILSLLKFNPDKATMQIRIYTDQPEYFRLLPADIVQCILLTSETIEAYKGRHKFVHRVKIETLLDCCLRFQDANILYVDSDVYYLKPIHELFSHISSNHFVMCNKEGKINSGSNIIFNKFSAFVSKNSSYLHKHDIDLAADAVMWNAGVLGLKSQHRPVVQEVLYTSDTIYDAFASHVVEQMSFSFCLNKYGTIQESTDYLFHYWNFKEFRPVLADFFHYHFIHSDLNAMIADVDSIRPDILIKAKMDYEALPFLQKNLRKLKGKQNRWRMPAYIIGKNTPAI